jgi:lipopolysaccharide biosynthesis glycosyltransferase
MNAVYTSANLRYLARARTLAQSVRTHSPDTTFYLVLVDSVPDALRAGVEDGSEPFDHVLTPADLDIPDFESWIFQHDVVEACTAVKAAALVHLLEQRREERVLYLDPDIVVFSSLDGLFAHLDESSVLLTPHCPVAETDPDLIARNEISSLAHGTFNLGFLGVAASDEGRRLANWWQHRLYLFCHDDIPRGLFTDQRWIDLVPGQFDGVKILRDAVYNAASWNITQRRISGSVPDDLLADGEPLCFYHFSGERNPETQPDRAYPDLNSEIVTELADWYYTQCRRNGEADCERTEWIWRGYRNGQPIDHSHRVYYRSDPELQQRFPNPFAVGPGSFLEWLTSTGPGLSYVENLYGQTTHILQQKSEQLFRIEQSLPYRLYVWMRRFI